MSEMLKTCLTHLQNSQRLLEEDPEFRFAVHEHRATRHHYDFSLQVGDMLLTWVLPDGPSLNPDHKQKAQETDLHNPRYIANERYIPAGHKGSGPKMLWDQGEYRFDGATYLEAVQTLQDGHFDFILQGQKLKGAWTLQRISGKSWTLAKKQDEHASTQDVRRLDRSVISQKRLNDFELGPAAWVELPHFYVAQHPQDRPVVVVKEGHVLDLNPHAATRKISVGMTVRAAKSILSEAEYIAWREEDYRARQLEWLDACLEFTDAIEPVEQHGAFLDFKLHPDPVSVAEDLVRALAEKTRLSPRTGLAKAKWIARLAAELDDRNQALQDPKRFIANLPIALLAPAQQEHRTRLQFLGYSTIGQAAEIPFGVLQEQFGEQVYAIHQAARGGYCEPVKPIYPPDALADRFAFPGGTESWETILEGAQTWSTRIGKRLQRQSVEGAKVRLTLEFEEGPPKTLARTFAKPVRCPRTAFMALRLMLEGQIDRPLTAIRILLPELRKVQTYQPSLFDAAKVETRIQPALNHVRTVFGDKAIELGTQREEPRRVKVLRMWKHATGWQ